MLSGSSFIYTFRTLHTRLCSSYVKHARFLFDLKENDDACRQELQYGSFYLFHNLSPLFRNLGRSFCSPAVTTSDLKKILAGYGKDELIIEESVLIGSSGLGRAEFAIDLGSLDKSNLEKDFSGKFTELRKIAMQLTENELPLLAKAQSLLRWHADHQYCSRTGKPTQKNVSGSKRTCHTGGLIYYPQMSPVVIMLVSYKNRCLLARQNSYPAGMYTALSGFCDIGETLEETVRREVAEEVGLDVEFLRYSASQHWPFPNSSLMVACHATVQQEEISLNTAELESARWFTLGELEKALQWKQIPEKEKDGTAPIWVPPKIAIAHHLIQEWVQEQKANLQEDQ
ncbi:hypothetical protein GDO86_013202 [Hymenochirus boettgeri]|uniref:NAD(+) diphosphatase n=1 Tax=Hymenochirus boettgeri TaxID=247094 RepID=A0A8T2ITW9_9PIPI|nr:hypothetical protein GDO86_013202 [Hymenochirus boettgeri]